MRFNEISCCSMTFFVYKYAKIARLLVKRDDNSIFFDFH